MHSKGGLEAGDKIKIYCPYQELNPGSSARNRLNYSSSRPRTIQEQKKNITSQCSKFKKQMLHGFRHHGSIGFAGVYVLKGKYFTI